MALSELEIKRCEKALAQFLEKNCPPAHIREQVDIGYRITGQSIEIFEVRPGFRDPSKKTEISVAKATYVKSQDVWKVYWMRQDLKWHLYPPVPQVNSLVEFLALVEDANACFFC